LSDDEAVKKLKEAIFKTVRLDREDPFAAWDEHLEKLESRGKKLNELQLDRLHYTTKKGTDLTIGLPENHVWMGAVSEDDRKNIFLPNLPTEEIFTAPDKNRIDGVVYSTKPLNLSGTIVDEFKVVFEKGKAEVKVDIKDEAIERLNMEHMSEERLEHFGKYNLDEAVDYAEDGCFYLSITGGDPDLFKGIDPKRIAMRSKAAGKVMKTENPWIMFLQRQTLRWIRI
jgi:leucyl aminopeptidase (aminopeptidase T)